MTITGLTRRQVFLLDKMWSIKGVEEYEEWNSSLDTLEQLVVWAELDDITDVSDAQRVLGGIA